MMLSMIETILFYDTILHLERKLQFLLIPALLHCNTKEDRPQHCTELVGYSQTHERFLSVTSISLIHLFSQSPLLQFSFQLKNCRKTVPYPFSLQQLHPDVTQSQEFRSTPGTPYPTLCEKCVGAFTLPHGDGAYGVSNLLPRVSLLCLHCR